MYKICSSLVCFWLALSLPAQSLQSTILDFNTREPIPFVNIGILGKNIGTVSDANGQFTLDIPQAEMVPSDTLRFSSIGYQSLDFLVKDLATLPKGNPTTKNDPAAPHRHHQSQKIQTFKNPGTSGQFRQDCILLSVQPLGDRVGQFD